MADLTVISMAQLTVKIVEGVTGRGPGIGETPEDFLRQLRRIPDGDMVTESAERTARLVMDYINECVRNGAKLDLGDAKAMN